MANNGLVPDEHTIKEHRIPTADGFHKLYVQEWGNPEGVPILYLHGGPGAGCRDKHKNLFNPKKHRVVFIDQRGSGNSEPYGSLKENTTPKLVEDIETVREKLGIDKWHVHGTSWGSTLALCYAIKHPGNIKSMVIGGIWLCTPEEIEWLTKGQYRMFYPDAWDRFNQLNPKKDEIDFFAYSSAFIQFYKLDDRTYPLDREKYDDTPLKIEFEYFKHDVHLPKNHIMDNASKISMPVRIVQGRYDFVTPPKAAYELDKKLPDSELFWTVAGHSVSDRGNYDTIRALLSQLN
ncbi:MAG TPA: alpha/beta fold hydrolase [Candidatus Saccharimonadales bacterium]|nr:alpha/beta fold hydrolase [Candidatus Saccharimonadales bacterium]